MNKLKLAAIIWLSIVAAAFGNQRINILWIGNSLTGQGICDVGSFQVQWYVNECKSGCDTSKQTATGYILASGDALAGATQLNEHWAAGRGLKDLGGPSYVGGGEYVRDPLGWGSVQVDYYDYVVLQPWNMLTEANRLKEQTAFGRYCDTMLALDVKPVIFALFMDSSAATFTKFNRMYDSLYNKYKSRGALIAPVYRAFKKAWDVVGPAALFASGDVYGHQSAMGVYLQQCVFYATFTKHRSANIDWALSKAQCPGLSALDATHDFLEEKADEAVAEYYTLEGSPTRTVDKNTAHVLPLKKGGFMGRYDLTGRTVTKNRAAGAGIYIVKNAFSSVSIMEIRVGN